MVGAGYVGLVSGACFSEMGNKVTCVDIDAEKIENLNKGIIPIYESGLEEMVLTNTNRNTLSFTTDLSNALEDANIVFIAVGTPMGEDGSADLSYVLSVAKSIGQKMHKQLIVVDKSTVPVGTADKVRATIQQELDKRGVSIPFDVVSNPEFLKEGVAIADFIKPDRVIVGADNPLAMKKMKQLYAPFFKSRERFIEMDIRSAEMTKYVANAMLATKISFMNEMANICERVGADINKVRVGIGSDSRIGYSFIYPGCGYGGSCFPKDVNALIKMADEQQYNATLVKAVEEVNDRQKLVLAQKVVKKYGEDLTGKVFGVWGLSFKPSTDDMRKAPSIDTITELVKRGAKIQAYDPKAMKYAREFYLKDLNITYVDRKYKALENADAMILFTEWKEFRSPDFEEIGSLLKEKVIFDGRNQYGAFDLEDFEYYQIGV